MDKGELDMSMEPLIVTVPPARIGELRGLRAVPAHQGYRIGGGPTSSGRRRGRSLRAD